MSTHWWRAYDEAVDDPKIQLMPGPLFKAWFNLLCIASGNGGSLPDVESIAFKLRTTGAKIGSVLDELVKRGLLDDVDGELRPHNWNGRQFKSDVTDPTAAERMRNYRNRKRNGDGNGGVSVTPPREEQIAETDSETEKKDAANAASSAARYAFESGVIRLSQKHFDQWKTAFSHLDLPAELIGMTEWASRQPSWFNAVAGLLAKRNAAAHERIEQAKNRPAEPTLSQKHFERSGIEGVQ